MPGNVTVRLATEADIDNADALCALAESGIAHTRFAVYGASKAKLLRLLDTALARPDVAVLLLAEIDGACCGMLYGAVTEHPICPITYAASIAFYVQPEARGLTGKKLIEAFEQVAREHGAAEVVLGTSSGVDADRTVQLYKTLGYTVLGALALKTLEPNHV
ncbi:MAG: N-acetyltransferase family protein [Phycisphaerales bacterium]